MLQLVVWGSFAMAQYGQYIYMDACSWIWWAESSPSGCNAVGDGQLHSGADSVIDG